MAGVNVRREDRSVSEPAERVCCRLGHQSIGFHDQDHGLPTALPVRGSDPFPGTRSSRGVASQTSAGTTRSTSMP